MKYSQSLEESCKSYNEIEDFNGARGIARANAKYSKMDLKDLERDADIQYAHSFLTEAKPLYEGGNLFYSTYEKAKVLTSHNPKFSRINGMGGKKLDTLWCAKNGETNHAAAIGSMFEREYKKAERILKDLNQK